MCWWDWCFTSDLFSAEPGPPSQDDNMRSTRASSLRVSLRNTCLALLGFITLLIPGLLLGRRHLFGGPAIHASTFVGVHNCISREPHPSFNESTLGFGGKTVWLFWYQGWDAAPWAAWEAARSWAHHNPSWSVKLLSAADMCTYAPEVLADGLHALHHPAAVADRLKLAVLAKYGGVWANAAALCMGPLDTWVYDALDPEGFWMFREPVDGRTADGVGDDGSAAAARPAAWLIASLRHSYIIRTWKAAADEHWRLLQHSASSGGGDGRRRSLSARLRLQLWRQPRQQQHKWQQQQQQQQHRRLVEAGQSGVPPSSSLPPLSEDTFMQLTQSDAAFVQAWRRVPYTPSPALGDILSRAAAAAAANSSANSTINSGSSGSRSSSDDAAAVRSSGGVSWMGGAPPNLPQAMVSQPLHALLLPLQPLEGSGAVRQDGPQHGAPAGVGFQETLLYAVVSAALKGPRGRAAAAGGAPPPPRSVSTAPGAPDAPQPLDARADRADLPYGNYSTVVVLADCRSAEGVEWAARECARRSMGLVVLDKCNLCRHVPLRGGQPHRHGGGARNGSTATNDSGDLTSSSAGSSNGSSDDSPVAYCRPLVNLGRESATYLHFAIRYYHHLPQHIILVPSALHKYERRERLIEMFSAVNSTGCYSRMSARDRTFSLDMYEGRPITPAPVRPFRAWFEQYIGPWKRVLRPGPCFNGLMRTTRERILRHPPEFFRELYTQTMAGDDIEVGHFIERSLTHIF